MEARGAPTNIIIIIRVYSAFKNWYQITSEKITSLTNYL